MKETQIILHLRLFSNDLILKVLHDRPKMTRRRKSGEKTDKASDDKDHSSTVILRRSKRARKLKSFLFPAELDQELKQKVKKKHSHSKSIHKSKRASTQRRKATCHSDRNEEVVETNQIQGQTVTINSTMVSPLASKNDPDDAVKPVEDKVQDQTLYNTATWIGREVETIEYDEENDSKESHFRGIDEAQLAYKMYILQTQLLEIQKNHKLHHSKLQQEHKLVQTLQRKLQERERACEEHGGGRDCDGSELRIDQIINGARKFLPEPAFSLFAEQLRRTEVKGKELSWSGEVKKFSLMLYRKSPTVYQFFEEVFLMPPITQLQIWAEQGEDPNFYRTIPGDYSTADGDTDNESDGENHDGFENGETLNTPGNRGTDKPGSPVKEVVEQTVMVYLDVLQPPVIGDSEIVTQ